MENHRQLVALACQGIIDLRHPAEFSLFRYAACVPSSAAAVMGVWAGGGQAEMTHLLLVLLYTRPGWHQVEVLLCCFHGHSILQLLIPLIRSGDAQLLLC